MELRDIRYFTVVAEHLHIGRAAEALSLSATALSKSLRRLERSVGAKLVQRAGKGIDLTVVGKALLARLGPLQGMLNDVSREATDLAQGLAGQVHVGTTVGAAENLIADACILLSKEALRIELQVCVLEPDHLASALQKGEIDFYVGRGQTTPLAGLVHELLYEDQDVVFASANHRLARQKQVSLEDLAQERWALTTSVSRPLLRYLTVAFHNRGLAAPKVGLDTNSQTVRLPAIAATDLVAFSSREFMRREAQRYGLVELPVKELSHFRSLSLVYRKDAYLSPATLRLIELLKTQAAEISTGKGREKLSVRRKKSATKVLSRAKVR